MQCHFQLSFNVLPDYLFAVAGVKLNIVSNQHKADILLMLNRSSL